MTGAWEEVDGKARMQEMSVRTSTRERKGQAWLARKMMKT